MTAGLRFTRRALVDIEEIGGRIAGGGNPARAVTFVRALRQRCAALAEFPEWGMLRPHYGAGVRAVPFGRFLILYRWDAATRIVRISRVVGAAQRATPV